MSYRSCDRLTIAYATLQQGSLPTNQIQARSNQNNTLANSISALSDTSSASGSSVQSTASLLSITSTKVTIE